MAVLFKLKPGAEDKPLLIMMFYFVGRERIVLSTNKRVQSLHWDEEQQRARKSHPGFSELNAFLKSLAGEADKIHSRLQAIGKPFTIHDIKTELQTKFFQKAEKQEQAIDLFGFIADYIEKSKLKRSKNTIKSYRVTEKHLKDYQSFKKVRLNFDSIDLNFYNDFIHYLFSKKHLGPNGAGNQIKNLKVFLNEATELGHNRKLDFRSRKFKKLENESENIYLNKTEIQTIADLDLSTNPKLDRVRDLFIIACYTGLRYSDFSQLKRENFENGMIRVKTEKMKNNVMIPIHPLVKKIIEKYSTDGTISIPEAISNQKMNDYVKEVGKLANITQEVQISHYEANKLVKQTYQKYELISSHTARRSFATNLYLQGFPSISIMKITGHKTEKAFLKYIKVTEEENAYKLQKFWEDNG